MGNGKEVALEFLGGTCCALGDSCGPLELPRRDGDEPLEVVGELALVREVGADRGSVHGPRDAVRPQRFPAAEHHRALRQQPKVVPAYRAALREAGDRYPGMITLAIIFRIL
jgi:hypothetical protein